jgi:hypothetical protein
VFTVGLVPGATNAGLGQGLPFLLLPRLKIRRL